MTPEEQAKLIEQTLDELDGYCVRDDDGDQHLSREARTVLAAFAEKLTACHNNNPALGAMRCGHERAELCLACMGEA